ncbi:hypothetical protein PYV61_21515, partial [Roseisolibacter sp. H3M3-2]
MSGRDSGPTPARTPARTAALANAALALHAAPLGACTPDRLTPPPATARRVAPPPSAASRIVAMSFCEP